MAGPQDPNQNPLPQRVVPQNMTRPIDPDEIYDMTIGPGDSAVQAAYSRTNRSTTFLGPIQRQGGEGDRTDALMLRKVAKQSRSLTFTVQGIMWRAGFAPDMSQTPLGQSSPFRRLTDQDTTAPSGAILRPAESQFELVFRELIPRGLLEQCDQMYGPVRKLERLALFYFPAGEGATAGVMASYSDQPASRAHVVYLQTNIKNGSPTVLDQIHKTFSAAVPKAVEAAKDISAGDFWQELDKSLYQVTATFKKSVMGGGTKAATTSVQRSMEKTGNRVDSAMSGFGRINKGMDAAAKVPGRVGVAAVRGMTEAVVGLIQGIDKILKPKS